MKIRIEYVILLLLLLLSVILGKNIASQPMGFPLYFMVAVFVVIISILDIRVALGILILSMLLSPEISLGRLTYMREVVVRFDDLILIVIFFVWLAKMAINKKLPLIKSTPLNKYIYCYIGACIIFTMKGIIVGDVVLKRAVFYLLKYIEYFMIFWMTYNLIEKKKDVKILLTFATITAIAVIVYGYTQTGRVTPPFDSEINTMGGYLILVSAISLGVYLFSDYGGMKYFSLSIFILCIPLLMRTQSRASYLAFATMFISMIFISKKGRQKLIFMGIFLMILIPIIFAGGIYKVMAKRVHYTFTGDYGQYNIEPSAAARLTTWKKMATKMWPQKPFFGWGITGQGFIDGQYVRTLVEIGAVGTAAFLLMLYGIFTESKKVLNQIKIDWGKGIVVGFMAAHAGLLVHALTSNTFIIVRIMEPFWFLLAVIMALPKLEVSSKKAGDTL